jgi:hypothetical protein
MSNYDTLNKLDSTGELKSLVNAGLMPVKICYHLEVYRFVDMRIKTGSKVNAAVTEASVSMKMCRASIFKIMRGFKQK